MVRAQVHQAVKALAVDQGLQIGTDQYVGRWLTRSRIPFDADRMGGSGLCQIAHMGLKRQDLRLARAGCFEIHRDKWGIFDRDAHFFDRSDQKIIFSVFT